MNLNQANAGGTVCSQCGLSNGHSMTCPTQILQQPQTTYTNNTVQSSGTTYYPLPNQGLGSSGTYPGVFSGFAQTTSNSVIEYVCTLCGDKFAPALFSHPPAPYMCSGCEQKVKLKILEMMVPPDSKEHCPHCRFHVNACKCPENQKMDELVK